MKEKEHRITDHQRVAASVKANAMLEILTYSIGALLGVYVFFRLIFAAYFRAKQQYEENHYGKKPQQGTGTR